MQVFQLSMHLALWFISPCSLEKCKLDPFQIKSTRRCIPATTGWLVPRTKEEPVQSKTLETHAEQTSGCHTENSTLQFATPANGDASKASTYRPRTLWRTSSRWQSADSSDSKQRAGGPTSGSGLKDSSVERRQ